MEPLPLPALAKDDEGAGLSFGHLDTGDDLRFGLGIVIKASKERPRRIQATRPPVRFQEKTTRSPQEGTGYDKSTLLDPVAPPLTPDVVVGSGPPPNPFQSVSVRPTNRTALLWQPRCNNRTFGDDMPNKTPEQEKWIPHFGL